MRHILTKFSSMFDDEDWLPAEGCEILDFRSLEGTGGYCDPEAEKHILSIISGCPLNAVHWIDSGDYHYMTALWLRNLKSPSGLVLFDNHPDDQPDAFGSDILSCGSWMLEARRNPMVKEDSERVYLSIDLDVLSPDYARTNWDQGSMSLEELFGQIRKALQGKTLAGVDICGGITIAQGASAEDLGINRRCRYAIEGFLNGSKIF